MGQRFINGIRLVHLAIQIPHSITTPTRITSDLVAVQAVVPARGPRADGQGRYH